MSQPSDSSGIPISYSKVLPVNLAYARAQVEAEVSPSSISNSFFRIFLEYNFRQIPDGAAKTFHSNLKGVLHYFERHHPGLARPAPPAPPTLPPPPAVPVRDVQMTPAPLAPATPAAPANPPQGPSESWSAVTARSKGPKAPKVKPGPPPATAPPAKAKPTEKPRNKHNRVVVHVGRKSLYTGRFSGEEALVSASRAINSALASAGQSTHCLHQQNWPGV
ncbi:hypothetical protein CTheo_6821 [Ceratobasidium theobromae]|uniref:Uncharacterized protein n=1 Tax=Ceratobasidium theobromae TaxID=1582974 RepID=A0A5N5QEJ8_9AGAM|nr:hypothetical protein CTheo_6821 [Ceratobasidium theobromae]